MKRFLLAVSLIAAGAAAGYYYSGPVYSRLMLLYYTKVAPEAFEKRLARLSGYLQGRDYVRFEADFRRLSAAFPDERELYRIAAPYYLVVKRDIETGSYCLRRGLTYTANDRKLLEEGIPALYFGGLFGDVEDILRRYTIAMSPQILYYRGAALCRSGDGEAGLPYLLQSYRTLPLEDADLYIGQVYERRARRSSGAVRKENLRLAETYYRRGLERRPFSEDVRESLLRIYTLEGKAAEGAALMKYGTPQP